ncbi:Dolichyl-phosphate-mannose-protein mannosyltransferase-domain-containing protein [Spinellus fusiger]|nr:Dolichyl-phosphate-mannose-protein mannosyltransferase-domain-containing protein [Spinellus fusiger]
MTAAATSTHSREEKEKKKAVHSTETTRGDTCTAVAVGVLAILVRYYLIAHPHQVVFDEVHFGTFAGKYIRNEFFFDVHPPLAKMLIALTAQWAGYDGSFDFSTIGNEYVDVPYTVMRGVGAGVGALLAPMAYVTLREGGHSFFAALLAALAVCFENSLVTNNRLIMLDSYLLFFTAFTVMAWAKFHRQAQRPFQRAWWKWLTLTGMGLGFTVSCKWVGLFVIATVGCSTVKDLWRLWGDLRVTSPTFLRHLAARSLCLIMVPCLLYTSLFFVHFQWLVYAGEGDMHMSTPFQQSLQGHEVPDTPVDVVYGSRVIIRHLATQGGYLHSHNASYPLGSKQQQVTLYPHHDINNVWIIRKMDSTVPSDKGDILGSDHRWLEWVRHGDIIRLEHEATQPHKLHSHDVRAPVTDYDYHREVSGYGFPNYEGDANDYWRVDILEPHHPKDSHLEAMHSKFRLVHIAQNCALFSHQVALPEWGFGQQEVTCMQSAQKPKSLWMIEFTEHPQLPDSTVMVNYKIPGFWAKFKEMHAVMWHVNAGLTGTHPYESRPSTWPMLQSGISFWAGREGHIFYIGNPMVYWASTVAVFTFGFLVFFFRVQTQLGRPERFPVQRPFYEQSAGFYSMGWVFHYVPFYFMKRQLFLHHYLPALYFAILVLAVGVDLVFLRLSHARQWMVTTVLAFIIVYSFWVFSPLSYGTPWTREECWEATWVPTWEFGCERYISHEHPVLPLGGSSTESPAMALPLTESALFST